MSQGQALHPKEEKLITTTHLEAVIQAVFAGRYAVTSKGTNSATALTTNASPTLTTSGPWKPAPLALK